jgi:acyl-ACP thioesterase
MSLLNQNANLEKTWFFINVNASNSDSFEVKIFQTYVFVHVNNFYNICWIFGLYCSVVTFVLAQTLLLCHIFFCYTF